MMLALDGGNSRLKWGLHDGTAWVATGAVAWEEAPGLAPAIAACGAPVQAAAVNVAGTAGAARIEAVAAALGCPLQWMAATAWRCGVRNGYRDPAQLGADRWAALIGARHLHPGDCLVVLAGTATTIDVLGDDGKFRGGLILPGFDLMRRALAGATAQLPLGQGAPADLPRSTDEAIVSGCLFAQAGAVARMFRHVAAAPGAICLLSGGGAERLAGVLEMPRRVVETLVLEGVVRAAAEDDADA